MNDDATTDRPAPVLDAFIRDCVLAADTTCLRLVTAACVFDGDDVAPAIVRRLHRAHRAEVIHLGPRRSAHELVRVVVEEDADALLVSSQSGGNADYFRDLVQMLRARGAGHVPVFVSTHDRLSAHEYVELEASGVAHVYRGPVIADAQLVQMMAEISVRAQAARAPAVPPQAVPPAQDQRYAWWPKPDAGRTPAPLPQRAVHEVEAGVDKEGAIARMLSLIEGKFHASSVFHQLRKYRPLVPGALPVIGISGAGGAGKSSLLDGLLTRFLAHFPKMRIAVLTMSPSCRRSGGALLGDRSHMHAVRSPRVYLRQMAARGRNMNAVLQECIGYLRGEDFDLVLVETAGTAPGDSTIVDIVDVPVYVMTPDYGASGQLEKIDMLDYADIVVLNKYDQPGAGNALVEVCQQWRENHQAHAMHEDDLPVYPTMAHHPNDPGLNWMFAELCRTVLERMRESFPQTPASIGLQTGVEISAGSYSLNLLPARCDFRPVLAGVDISSHAAGQIPPLRGGDRAEMAGSGGTQTLARRRGTGARKRAGWRYRRAAAQGAVAMDHWQAAEILPPRH